MQERSRAQEQLVSVENRLCQLWYTTRDMVASDRALQRARLRDASILQEDLALGDGSDAGSIDSHHESGLDHHCSPAGNGPVYTDTSCLGTGELAEAIQQTASLLQDARTALLDETDTVSCILHSDLLSYCFAQEYKAKMQSLLTSIAQAVSLIDCEKRERDHLLERKRGASTELHDISLQFRSLQARIEEAGMCCASRCV